MKNTAGSGEQKLLDDILTDILNGGPGNDQLWGGPNDDNSVFELDSGNDAILSS
jgi:hypothetical protein